MEAAYESRESKKNKSRSAAVVAAAVTGGRIFGHLTLCCPRWRQLQRRQPQPGSYIISATLSDRVRPSHAPVFRRPQTPKLYRTWSPSLLYKGGHLRGRSADRAASSVKCLPA